MAVGKPLTIAGRADDEESDADESDGRPTAARTGSQNGRQAGDKQ